MGLPDITAGQQDTSRLSCRRVCFVGSLGSNPTDRAVADRSRSTSHIGICFRSAGVITSPPSLRVAQVTQHKQIGSRL